jgi:putative FmdB family regulatory protein
MPTYDYICESCGHKFEEFQSIKAKPLKKCPSCGKPKLNRLIGTGAGIIFKGSGFYATDYRSDSYKSSAKSDHGQSPVEAAKADTGKESKPENQASPKTQTKPDTKASTVIPSANKSDENKTK